MLVLSGGDKDFNINRILEELKKEGIQFFPVLIQKNEAPQIIWDIVADKLILNNQIIKPKSVFLRRDVFNSFGGKNDDISNTIYRTLREWAFAHSEVSIFNRNYRGMNKSYNLSKAIEVGFDIPYTVVTNKTGLLKDLKKPEGCIVKPVNGGAYTVTVQDFLINKSNAHIPVKYVQNRLIQPEMRIFGIGNQFFAFHVISEQLDYRVDKTTKVKEVTLPEDLVVKLSKLMKNLQLDFCAADFKTCPITKKYKFLEVNSGPMFSKFDKAANGKISKAIIDWHVECQ